MDATKTRVLFFAEGATLAHVARPYVLATSLDPSRFDVVFARPESFAWLTSDPSLRRVSLGCQEPSIFARRLERGQPLYDLPTLESYVEEDLALIDRHEPDVIIGDFRLSLSVSARLRSIPYITICDAYWSPERPLHAPLPVLGFTPFTPLPLVRSLFRMVSPIAFRHHTVPMERLRANHGLPSLNSDLRRCYTDADLRLFANFPELFPEIQPSAAADFIGPIAWSPDPDPELDLPGTDRPLAYVTMGSSGDPRVLTDLVPLLDETGWAVWIATAGKFLPRQDFSPKVRFHDYLPGAQVCAQAQLVVCNGGSPTTNQALAAGVPVLGIARNMDQFLNMHAIEDYGAGITVRADRAGKRRLNVAIAELTSSVRYAEHADSLARSHSLQRTGANLAVHIDRLCAGCSG